MVWLAGAGVFLGGFIVGGQPSSTTKLVIVLISGLTLWMLASDGDTVELDA